MFKKYTYFFIPFLVYFSAYGMNTENLKNNFLNLSYNELSSLAQAAIQALAQALKPTSNKEDAEKEFANTIMEIYRNPQTTCNTLNNRSWNEIKQTSDLSILFASNTLQTAFEEILAHSRVGEGDTLMANLKSLLEPVAKSSRDKERSSSKFSSKKYSKTDTLNDKNKNSENSQESTISPGLSFNKVIATVGILSAIALLFYKHSKAQEHTAQAA